MEVLKRLKRKVFINAAIAFVIGLVLLLNPIKALSTVGALIGVLFILMGVIDLVQGWKQGVQGEILGAVIKVVIGIFLISHATRILSMFSLLFSIIILIFGINGVSHGLQLKERKIPGWKLNLSVSALILVAGIVLLLNPFGAVELTARVVGGVLVIHAINESITFWNMKQMNSDLYGTIRDEMDEMEGNIIDMEERK